ncbi:hypothetical protein BHM03_00023804 [Ensete ventricosum]|nr:hypothetical protein BHM03_00023804 [Ensete ventricosum]
MAIPPIGAVSALLPPEIGDPPRSLSGCKIDFDCHRSIPGDVSRGRKKKREKKNENLEIRHYFLDPDPRSRASQCFAGTIFVDREEKKTTYLLPARASWGTRASCRGFAERFLLSVRGEETNLTSAADFLSKNDARITKISHVKGLPADNTNKTA